MEAPDLYLAIRVSNLSLVLALAAGQPPKFEQLAWKTAAPGAATIKAPRAEDGVVSMGTVGE